MLYILFILLQEPLLYLTDYSILVYNILCPAGKLDLIMLVIIIIMSVWLNGTQAGNNPSSIASLNAMYNYQIATQF